MDWKVIFSTRSQRDLERIAKWIALDDPNAAEQFIFRLIDTAEALGTTPEMGSPSIERPGTRFFPVGPYLVIYRTKVRQRTVTILRFWHGARGKRPLR